jgi:hypothetical protein
MMKSTFALKSVCASFLLSFLLLPSALVHAQAQPFQMAGWGMAPEGISLAEPKPHWSVGGGNILGPHTGQGSIKIISPPVPGFDSKGNLVSLTANFTSGPATGYTFVTRNGNLATDYGVGPSVAGVPGVVVLRVLRNEGATLLVRAHFLANFEIDPNKSTGRFQGCSGRWLMDAKSTRPFRLNLATGTSEPFRYIWRSRPGTGTLICP